MTDTPNENDTVVEVPRSSVSRRRRRAAGREGTPSDWLFRLRQERGLTLRQIEEESQRIADELKNMEFYISGARLSQIENGSTVPSIYKLATLSRIYGVKYAKFLRAYGIDTDALPPDAPANLEPK